jgi:hypothetical protein
MITLKNEARRELRFTSFTSPEALLVNDFVCREMAYLCTAGLLSVLATPPGSRDFDLTMFSTGVLDDLCLSDGLSCWNHHLKNRPFFC